MNRIARALAETRSTIPPVSRSFDDSEAMELLYQYKRSPAELKCPTCKVGGTMVVDAFIHPRLAEDGWAEVVQPEGLYAVAVHCEKCRSAIGLCPDYKLPDLW